MTLKHLDRKLQKLMPLLTPTGVVLGVLFSQHLQPFAFLVPWMFGFMTFVGSLGSGLGEFVRSVTKPYQLIVTMIILHIVMPLIAFGIAKLLFPDDGYLVTGLLMGAVIPIGITSMIWVSVYRGNVPLTLSVILVDTMLSPFIVPFSLKLLVGADVHIDARAMSLGLLWMVVVPSLLGMLLHQITNGKIHAKASPVLSPLNKIGLAVVVAINSSVVAPYLKPFSWRVAAVAATVLFIASLGYMIGWLVARLCNWDRGILVSMVFNSGMRNISAGAVIALTYLPAPAAVPVILGMLFQQLLASVYGALISRFAAERSESGPVRSHAV